MPSPPLWLFVAAASAIGVALPLYAWRARGRTFATYSAILVVIAFPAASALGVRLDTLAAEHGVGGVGWLFLYAIGASGVHLSLLVRARMRNRFYRYAVSVPGQALVALGTLCVPYFAVVLPITGLLYWAGASGALSALRWLDLLPVAIVTASLATSMRLRREIVRIELGGDEPETLSRLSVKRHRRNAPPLAERPLRIVQITDPHLGPWQPVHRLRRRVEELMQHDPDLVLLTGDFLTMEGNSTPGALAAALAPLENARGKCFAIFGNHDHEAPDEVRSGLATNGIRLLVDDALCIDTPAGPVQILGADYHRKERKERIQGLLAQHPRQSGHVRLLLLHDPLGFRDVPKGEADLVLSGHTHGGQVGLVSLGLDWTVLSRSRWPDHGLFGHGPNRLYVHRGTGFYGFPLRVGVPGEASLLELVLSRPSQPPRASERRGLFPA